MRRTDSLSGRLARLGFADTSSLAEVVELWYSSAPQAACDLVLDELAAAADPDLAFQGFVRILRARPQLGERLGTDPEWARRLARVLGGSVALNQHLGAHPDEVEPLAGSIERRSATELRAELLDAVGADPADPTPHAEARRSDDLRRAYRRALLRIAARDLTAPDALADLPDIAAELADLADATVETAVALARGEVPGWECAGSGWWRWVRPAPAS